MKILDGRELAGFVKERQAHVVRSLRARKKFPKLVIVRDSENPVILKYVNLKKQYGEDIGVEVDEILAENLEDLKKAVETANENETVSGIIVQLPLKNPDWTDEVVGLIASEKDVDGLSGRGKFDSATAEAINWLLAGHNIELSDKKIAVVGRGRLVGEPLIKMWQNSGLEVSVFHKGSDFNELKDFDIVVTATGKPHLVKSEMLKSGAVVVDAGTASEDGVLVGDVDEKVRGREDIFAITPKVGGVGPLTVGVLFEHVLRATEEK